MSIPRVDPENGEAGFGFPPLMIAQLIALFPPMLGQKGRVVLYGAVRGILEDLVRDDFRHESQDIEVGLEFLVFLDGFGVLDAFGLKKRECPPFPQSL